MILWKLHRSLQKVDTDNYMETNMWKRHEHNDDWMKDKIEKE